MCYRHLSRRCAIRSTCSIRKKCNAIDSGMRMVVENTKEFDGFSDSRQPEKPVRHSRI